MAAPWLPSLRRDDDDWSVMFESLQTLYAAGAAVDWAGFEARRAAPARRRCRSIRSSAGATGRLSAASPRGADDAAHALARMSAALDARGRARAARHSTLARPRRTLGRAGATDARACDRGAARRRPVRARRRVAQRSTRCAARLGIGDELSPPAARAGCERLRRRGRAARRRRRPFVSACAAARPGAATLLGRGRARARRQPAAARLRAPLRHACSAACCAAREPARDAVPRRLVRARRRPVPALGDDALHQRAGRGGAFARWSRRGPARGCACWRSAPAPAAPPRRCCRVCRAERCAAIASPTSSPFFFERRATEFGAPRRASSSPARPRPRPRPSRASPASVRLVLASQRGARQRAICARALRALRALLAPGGMLLLVESTDAPRLVRHDHRPDRRLAALRRRRPAPRQSAAARRRRGCALLRDAGFEDGAGVAARRQSRPRRSASTCCWRARAACAVSQPRVDAGADVDGRAPPPRRSRGGR